MDKESVIQQESYLEYQVRSIHDLRDYIYSEYCLNYYMFNYSLAIL